MVVAVTASETVTVALRAAEVRHCRAARINTVPPGRPARRTDKRAQIAAPRMSRRQQIVRL